MNDPHGRQLLPQANSVGIKPHPGPSEPREGQKNYVFVNEHDRQKRLKVMRACEACRKRKIKCDAVTTNSWPCSKCQRSNLECVPPTSDGAATTDSDFFVDAASDDAQGKPLHSGDMMSSSYVWAANQQPSPAQQRHPQIPPTSNYAFSAMPAQVIGTAPHYQPQLQRSFTEQFDMPGPDFANYQPFATSRAESAPLTSSAGREGSSWRGQSPEEDLAEALGDLQIDQHAVAPYMINSRALADGPAIDETEVALPAQTGRGSTVRIPDEMMPSDELAAKYFDYYFTNIHPYVPVLNRNYFRMQWAQDRNTISPLILEGIFACATQMLNQPTERARWSALAARHEDSFKDVPRLSTLQGMLILLKSKEAVPKRGYYYRSWMTIVNMVAMAKDLGLHEHRKDHQEGRGCEPEDGDCAIKTRIWHTLFQLEVMVGGPQGRTEFSVHPDTVDLESPRTLPSLDSSELKISQDHSHLLRVISNVRESNQIYARLRRKADWAADPDFVAHAAVHDDWPTSLPQHLKITYPEDGSAPWIPFHVIGNIHSYHWLGVIMHHRPMLASASESFNGDWKQKEMRICYDAASKLCRLQEAIVNGFGLEGLMCMMRGINFSIYCVLTCTMIHLVAITSPDPDLNSNAADFFTRHMRILEKCADAWPMEEVRRQIDSLRQAFSADLSKPFELRSNFPYGSPSRSGGTPDTSYSGEYVQEADVRGAIPFNPSTLTPPASSGLPTMTSAPDFSSSMHQQYLVPLGEDLSASQATMQAQWNPSRIFDQWTLAFSPQPASQSTGSAASQTPQQIPLTTLYQQSPQQQSQQQDQWAAAYQAQQTAQQQLSTSPLPSLSHLQQQVPQNHVQSHTGFMQQQQHQVLPQQPAFDPMPTFITPSMWQEAVLDSYPDGLKRRGGTSISGPSGKRAAR